LTLMEARLNDPATMPGRSTSGGRRQGSDEPVEVRRYVDAVRRGRWLILTLAVSAALVAFLLSSLAPDRFTSTAIIVKRVTSATTDTASDETLSRELATIGKLLVTTDVLSRAADKVGGGETATSLSRDVKATVNPDANLIDVTATAKEDPEKAAAIANAVADTFVQEQTDVARQQYAEARQGLLQQLRAINHNDPAASQQEAAIRQRLSDLGVAQAAAGIDLTVAQRAGVPKSRTSPKPKRNAVIALFLGLFIGVLIALARDQLVPRVSGARELSRLLDLPMLAAIPYVRRRLLRRNVLTGAEYESYQTLGASVRFSLPAEEGPHVVLITSGLHAEGKSTVTARLGRALAQAGHPTLLISADLRWPTLHEIMDVPEEPGLTELLVEATERPRGRALQRMLNAAIVPLEQGRRGDLDVLPSGSKPSDPARLLAGDALDTVMDAIKGMDYRYVLIDAPPLLGIADTRALARTCTSLLFVARLDRITLDTVIDARDVLDRLELPAIGCVPIGTRSEASPYYMGLRTPALEDA
jgi:capsular exopolysaccharide synthesis family protein